MSAVARAVQTDTAPPLVEACSDAVEQSVALASAELMRPAGVQVRTLSSANDVADLSARVAWGLSTADSATSRSKLVPQRYVLLTKRSYRCQRCVAQGKPGILLSPQLHPLRGDRASAKTSAPGVWFRKQSMALSVLPSIQVTKLDDDSGRVWLQLTNPLAHDMEVTLSTRDSDAVRVFVCSSVLPCWHSLSKRSCGVCSTVDTPRCHHHGPTA